MEEERRTGTMFLERSSSKRRGQESSHFESLFQMSLRTWGKKQRRGGEGLEEEGGRRGAVRKGEKIWKWRMKDKRQVKCRLLKAAAAELQYNTQLQRSLALLSL